jgi:hypothetical protein
MGERVKIYRLNFWGFGFWVHTDLRKGWTVQFGPWMLAPRHLGDALVSEDDQ